MTASASSPAHVVAFEKWEGLGNDFIIVRDVAIDAAAARRLCDRRLGIGADGVLSVETSAEGGEATPRMIVFNADGSRPQMCGNGLRCVAAHLATMRGADARTIAVATDAGERRCEVHRTGDARFDVAIEMGIARIDGELEVVHEGRAHRFRIVDVGNPHAITFAPYRETEIDTLGPRVERAHPGGINVEFCRSSAARIDVVVWERGVGRTLACGTGACAVAALACDISRAAFDAPVRVALPGGELEIVVRTGTRAMTMRGPARRVFVGEAALS